MKYCFWENTFCFGWFWENFWEKGGSMIKRNFKGRCTKKMMIKCKDVVRTYNNIQTAYADVLEADEQVTEFQLNDPPKMVHRSTIPSTC